MTTGLLNFIYRRGQCKTAIIGLRCEYGLRKRTYNVLAGSVLNVWTRMEKVLAAQCGPEVKIQVVRLKTTDGFKAIGKRLFIVFSFY